MVNCQISQENDDDNIKYDCMGNLFVYNCHKNQSDVRYCNIFKIPTKTKLTLSYLVYEC